MSFLPAQRATLLYRARVLRVPPGGHLHGATVLSWLLGSNCRDSARDSSGLKVPEQNQGTEIVLPPECVPSISKVA